MLEVITDWRVIDEISLSDHRHLEFSPTIEDEQNNTECTLNALNDFPGGHTVKNCKATERFERYAE